MARIHIRRSTTADSLYRGRTPTDPGASDKENRGPETQESTMEPPPKSALPVHLNKRRRIEDRGFTPMTQFLTQHPIPQDEDEETKYYDPDQDETYRRNLRQEMYRNQMQIQANRQELISGNTDLALKYIEYQNQLMDRVRQTSDAAVDSRVMLGLTSTLNKRFANSAISNSVTTVDIISFVGKCISFMRDGQAAPRVSDESDEEEDDSNLQWDRLGDLAFSCNRRPAVPTFLLGPLSIEKRVRTTQRSARQRREDPAMVSRPEELNPEDLEKNENSNLTKLCEGIRERLRQIIMDGVEGIDSEQTEDMEIDEHRDLFKKYHLATNYEVSLFEFAVNPNSFAQTVENLFYISFLIRDGYVRIGKDDDGLPTLRMEDTQSNNEQAGQDTAKHQAIFSIDYKTWQQLVKAFDISEPLIPHRVEVETEVASRGWYG